MVFKYIKNTITGATRYYIDGTRVSLEKFIDEEDSCQFKGLKYNSSWLENDLKRKKITSVCCWD